MRGGRETTRSRRRSGSTSPMRPARRGRRSASSPERSSISPRRTRRRRCPATRTFSALSRSRSGTTCSRGSRCSSATSFASPPPPAAAEPSPLGAGALAGSTLPLPAPANQLRNSLDAVADRDFALDYLYAVTVCFVHLSRVGEELVLWTTAEFGFARLGEDAATGSSMMPQKLNPDVAELARGKAGTAIGRLTGLLATVKGLPLAYNRDLQEDKAPVFAARADLAGAVAALTALVRGPRARPRAARCCGGRSAPARHRRRRGARPRGRSVPRRARAGRRVGARRQLRGARAGGSARARTRRRRGRCRRGPRCGSNPCDAAASGGVDTA